MLDVDVMSILLNHNGSWTIPSEIKTKDMMLLRYGYTKCRLDCPRQNMQQMRKDIRTCTRKNLLKTI